MPRFFMFIQLSSATRSAPRVALEQARRISSKLAETLPQVRLVERYYVQNHCDLLDMLEAPAFDAVEHSANLVESLGHHVTEVMSATRWDQFEQMTRLPASGTGVSACGGRVDPVQHASEESFPASDQPPWTGTAAG